MWVGCIIKLTAADVTILNLQNRFDTIPFLDRKRILGITAYGSAQTPTSAQPVGINTVIISGANLACFTLSIYSKSGELLLDDYPVGDLSDTDLGAPTEGMPGRKFNLYDVDWSRSFIKAYDSIVISGAVNNTAVIMLNLQYEY